MMRLDVPYVNLVAAWFGILAGFFSGMLLGLGFHRAGFLGGYDSLQRRCYRLAHISFFGLAIVNVVFWLTAEYCAWTGPGLVWAAMSFLVGAVSMPVCCVTMAHWTRAKPVVLFTVPVGSLMLGGAVTVIHLLTQSTI